MANYKSKPMKEWTEEDFAADHADRMAAIAALAAESAREIEAMNAENE